MSQPLTKTAEMVPTHRGRYAGFWIRFAAGAVDYVILLIPTLVISYLLRATMPIQTKPDQLAVEVSDFVINMIVWWVFTAGFMASPWQATPGMKVCALRIVDYAGSRISFARATGRCFAQFLSVLILCIGYFMVAWTSRRQALHDLIAETLMLKEDGAHDESRRRAEHSPEAAEQPKRQQEGPADADRFALPPRVPSAVPHAHAPASGTPGPRRLSLKKFIITAALIAVLIPLWSWWRFGDCRYLLWSDRQQTILMAEKGHAWAQSKLGRMYDTGQGVPQSYEEASKWYSKAAKQGDAWAQNNLGVMYQNGQVVRRDDVEAYKWYCLSAAQGNTSAISNRDTLLRSLTPLQIAEGQRRAANPWLDPESVTAAQFERDFYETYPDLKPHGPTVDAAASRLQASGFRAGSREAVMEAFAKAAREELARQRESQPVLEGKQAPHYDIGALKSSAEKGDARAQNSLGLCYPKGEGVVKDEVQAVKWCRRAAEQNNALAQCFLGICYAEGEGVAKDYVESVKWLRKAAEQNNALAQSDLGWCYDKGQGVVKDEAEAVKWYRKAAEQNNALAQNNLGFCYAKGQGVAKDEVEAVKWYRKAAEQNDATAQNNLGFCYAKGQGVAKDEVEAVKWYRKAAEQNHADAQYSLAVCYDNGSGAAKDEVEALKWYRKAAEQGHAEAQYNLGVCYNDGSGVAKDEAEAVKWYRKAAERNDADAQCALGSCYYKGQGMAKNEAEAVKWYRKAAEQGHAEAQYYLGLCYAEGQGVTTNYVEAVKWYRKAAEQDDADAQSALGSCCYKGQGMTKNEAEAVKWFRKPAEGGEVTALNSLAWILATSENSAIRDGSSAVVFAEKAVATTNRKKPEALDTLAAAYAEAGEFGKAVSTEQEAIALQQTEAEKNDYTTRLKLFEAKVPYRAKD
jgi:TPR repeat protein/uncharacterized RDD family membrane protein YckC